MKKRKELEKEYQDIFNKKYEEINVLMPRDNTGYSFYGNAWASVVSIDIIGFKNMTKRLNNENLVKVIQLFTDTVASTARDDIFKDIFRDIYFAGDEVIVVFAAETKEKIDLAIDFTFCINTQINDILSDFLVKNISNLNNFQTGIGMWVSNDNTLIYNGLKNSPNFSRSTLLGTAINNANILSGLAGRGQLLNKKILMNNLSYINATTKKDSLNKWMSFVFLNVDNKQEKIYGGNIIKTDI